MNVLRVLLERFRTTHTHGHAHTRVKAASNSALQAQGKAVLITGCDGGFGHALAKHLHKLGFTVFAGCLLKVQVTKRGPPAKPA